MHALIRRYRVDPDSSKEVVRRVAAEYMPRVRKMDGFRGCYIVEAEDGVIITITICDNRAGVEAADRIAVEWIRDNLEFFLLGSTFGSLKGIEETIEGPVYGEELQGLDKIVPQHPDGNNSRLLTIDHVCEQLGMGKSWVYRRIRSGEIPSVRLGRVIKVKHADLDEYLEKQRYLPSDSISPNLTEQI